MPAASAYFPQPAVGSPPYGNIPTFATDHYQPVVRPAQYQTSQPSTNGFAVASLILGLLGVSVLSIVFGFVARSQIRKSNGWERGNGLALAGIILGFAWVAITVAIIVALAAAVHSCQYGSC